MLAAYINLGECFAQPISISLALFVGWCRWLGSVDQSKIRSLADVTT
jgi:hypothetical protein